MHKLFKRIEGFTAWASGFSVAPLTVFTNNLSYNNHKEKIAHPPGKWDASLPWVFMFYEVQLISLMGKIYNHDLWNEMDGNKCINGMVFALLD